MLRWLQSTVPTPGGYGGSAVRMHVAQKLYPKCVSPLSFPKHQSSILSGHSARFRAPSAVSGLPQNGAADVPQSSVLCDGAEYVSNERLRDLERLRLYLTSAPTKKLAPELLVSLYDSVRVSSQLKSFSATQLSTLISILGSSSLPPDAPRIRNNYVDGTSNTSGHWFHVLCVADDKKALGFLLNDGDHYWAMWAWLALSRSGDHVKALSNASKHYNQIWQKTKFPDILVPYLETLISTGSSEHLQTAVVDLCNILVVHTNLHGRSLKLIWDVFLSFSTALTPSMKTAILHALWSRSNMSHITVQRSNYMATHMFNPLTKRHERLPLDIAHLIASLGAPLFPFFLVSVPLSVQRWARRQTVAALSPSCSDEVRWTNFSLFALNQAARKGVGNHIPTLDPNFAGSDLNDWHIVLTLSILENVVNSYMASAQGSELCSLSGDLWERWMSLKADRPIFVSRAVVSSFLRLAARTQDTYILDQCYRYSIDHALWQTNRDHTAADRAQIEALIGFYFAAFIRCHGRRWADILHFLDVQKDLFVSGSHADFVIQRLSSLDIEIAFEFYEFCISHNVPVGVDITTMLATALAPVRVHEVFPMLERGLNHAQMEKVLLALLDTLRTQRYQYLNPASGRILGRALCKLLQSKAPVVRIKYPLRYSLLRLVASNCATDAIRIVELVNERAPSFLNARFLHRLLGIFLRHRQYTLAGRLYYVIKSRSIPAQDRFRRKLILGLMRGGANTFAKRFRSSRSTRSTVERMVTRLEFRGAIPCRTSSDRVLSIVRKYPNDIPSIKSAFSALVLSKRPVAAKRLFQDSLPYLDSPTKIWLGNMFLHRILRRFDKRNIQVVKKLLRAKNYLMMNFGFTGDRITFNILLKGMLRWKNVSSSKTRILFDDCIRMGYPVGSRWRRINNVPFGTQSLSSPITFGIPMPDPRISFQRHVRPLYKMFIKAFYLRKDVEAAKTVVGILKNEEAENLSRQQYFDECGRPIFGLSPYVTSSPFISSDLLGVSREC
ncbi:MAG: hypothetical protein NXY57DRAFT_1039679 [Lentinula lateritia]|nr:MAG: hypothetical protein NXY57DRAFT_1039679 [Lentinula lateritia]